MYEWGIQRMWFGGLAALGYRRVLIREVDLRAEVPTVQARVPATFGFLDLADVEEYTAFRRPAPHTSAARRLSSGERGFIARLHGSIVASSWAATGSAWSAYLSAPIRLAPDEVYLYDLFTRPDARGLGLASALHAEIYRFYQTQGFTRALAYTTPDNRRALGRGFGFRTIGTIRSLRIGPLRRDIVRLAAGARAPGAA